MNTNILSYSLTKGEYDNGDLGIQVNIIFSLKIINFQSPKISKKLHNLDKNFNFDGLKIVSVTEMLTE